MTRFKPLLPPLFALLLAGGLAGCDSSSSPGGGHDFDGTLAPIEGKIRFQIAEMYGCHSGECEPAIFLRMQTEKIYECFNFTIRSDIHRVGSHLLVDLRGIYRPSICFTAFGPATAADSLGLEPGNYDLRFRGDGWIDQYQVTVTDDALAVREVAADSTEASRPLIWRYPRRSFAYVCGTMTDNSWIYGAFLDSLLATDRFVEFAFPDSGRIPYPLGSGGYYYNPPARYFRYSTEADYDSAGALLGRYSRTVLSQQGGVGIYLQNWRNEYFRSWMLE